MSDAKGARLFAGIMTGTSADGADAVLAKFSGGKGGKSGVEILARGRAEAKSELSEELRELARRNGGEVLRAMEMRRDLTLLCADAFAALGASAKDVCAIGCHGQTVLHRPGAGLTLQLLDGALLAERTGADVICDFRARDVAAGGQGAPLAPLFHREFFQESSPCAVVNLGGIANITALDSSGEARGWDVGPGNMLMDGWHREHCGGEFDADGAWAAGGKADACILEKLRAHPFMRLPPPKSCGREEFDLENFREILSGANPRDAQATLLEWTAELVAGAAADLGVARIYLCGGGAKNGALRRRIGELFSGEVLTTDALGVPPDLMEAAAFAWLAKAHVDGKRLDGQKTTGAPPRILGARYPR